MREIKTIGDEVLRKTSEDVTAFDSSLDDLYNEMSAVMYESDGVGLACSTDWSQQENHHY